MISRAPVRPLARLAIAFGFSIVAPAACAARGVPEDVVFVHDDSTIVAPSSLIPVPLVRQEESYSCGDAVVLALLRFYERERFERVSEKSLYSPLGTTSAEGTEPFPMAEYFDHEEGISAKARWSTPTSYVTLDDLERAVDRGEPPIVALQAWQSVANLRDLRAWAEDWDDGHYVVVVAYDSNNLYFMDPSTADHYTYIPLPEFMDRWHDELGKAKLHAQHIVIFVHAVSGARAGRTALGGPVRVTAIH
jgi:predicted double-glycine peptidase